MLGLNNELLKYDNILDYIYPVGSYYETSDTTFNPNTAWGGTWLEDTNGRVTVAFDSNDTDFNLINKTGGVKNNTLTLNNMPKYVVQEFDSGQGPCKYASGGISGQYRRNDPNPVNNLQPYIVVKRWHRTA